MTERVFQYIIKENMIQAGDRVIVGVSGGADSVCLLFMLKEMKKKFPMDLIAVHIEHGLRGAESREDALFVEGLCREWDVEFWQYSYEADKIAAARKISLEEAGREIRYESFEKARQQFQAQKIAVAHNKNDNAETVMLNLARGTGIRGMAGIQAVRGTVIRPILELERREIETFLAAHGISYRTDATNLEDCYTRNKLRLHVLPYIETQINQEAVSHIAKSSEIFRAAETYLLEQASEAEKKIVTEINGEWHIPKETFLLQPAIIKHYLLLEIICKAAEKRKDIAHIHVEKTAALMEKEVGKRISLPYGCIAVRTYEGIVIKKNKTEETCIQIARDVSIPGAMLIEKLSVKIEFTLVDKEEGANIPQKKYTKWLDYGIIKGNLRVRTRQTGDYFIINKNGDRKKLKSYFIDCKIPKEERDQILLLAEGSHILWIIGYRISEWYKVKSSTKKILKVNIVGGN